MAKKMSEEKETWLATKKTLWKLDTKDLKEKLKQLEKELWDEQRKAISYGNKRMMALRTKHPNLKELRHRIACVKTIIKVKENA